jgi:hypothetical protein
VLAGMSAEQVSHWLRVEHRGTRHLAEALTTAARALAAPVTAPD